MKKITNIFFTAFLFSFFLTTFVVAKEVEKQDLTSSKSKLQSFSSNLGFLGFEASTSNVIGNILILVNTLFFIFMIYAGFLWTTSAGNEEKISKAKSIAFWGAIGMAVATSAYAITMFVLNKIG